MKPTEISDRGDMLASIDRSVFFTASGLDRFVLRSRRRF